MFVIDVQRAFPARADGAPRLTRDGFPAVVLAPDGRPGITVPEGRPAEGRSQVEVLKQGSGEIVEDGDSVVVHYTGVLWDGNDGLRLQLGRQRRPRPTFVVSASDDAQVDPRLLEGDHRPDRSARRSASSCRPSEGYGDQGNAQVPAGSTLFFVIDILGVI